MMVRILLADGADERARAAASRISGHSIVLLDEHSFQSLDPKIQDRVKECIEEKGGLVDDTCWLAAALVSLGEADGYVGGNVSTTSDVIRPALKLIGTTGYASSYFLMKKDGVTIVFADAAFNIDPSSEQLAQIAIDTAASAKHHGLEPRVAFLSFSSKGSASHPRVEKVRRAFEIAKEKAPDVVFDGELQFDAAFVPEVAALKVPDSPLKGGANVFIFPDLDSANISYKIMERLAGFKATGPIFQGFKKPVADLSRGCSVQDIVDVVNVLIKQIDTTKK